VCSMRVLSQWIGNFNAIRVTGGASRNNGILRLIADIFQADVQRIAVPDSCALGGAMRAANVIGGISFEELSGTFAATTSVIHPSPNSSGLYNSCLKAYEDFIRDIKG
jgi:xylulokinase